MLCTIAPRSPSRSLSGDLSYDRIHHMTQTPGAASRCAGFDDGASGSEQIEGNLKKKNKYGVWQTRFFWVNNQYLNYGPNKSKNEVSKVCSTRRRLFAV